MGNNNQSDVPSFKSNDSSISESDSFVFKNSYEGPYDIDENSTTKITQENSKNKNSEKKEEKRKKSGRKRKRENENGKNYHTKFAYDNIIRKIQVHFLNFLVSFINEILKHYEFKQKFFNIDYNIKKDIKKENIKNLKSLEIGEILCKDISKKYKNQYKEDVKINNKIYLEVIKNDNIRKILSEKYINIFKNIYYKNKRDLNDYGLNIKLSNDVKTYKDLLKKYNKDNDYKEEIIIAGKRCYIYEKFFIY